MNATGTPSMMNDIHDIQRFVLAGHAVFTLVSKKTGKRYTFKVNEKKSDSDHRSGFFFVSFLKNQSEYQCFGYVKEVDGEKKFFESKGFRGRDFGPAKAFGWSYQKLINEGVLPYDLEFYHEGRCGKCGRPLTVPESIKTGFGPVCNTFI